MSTKIEWADATWNPTTGCEKISPGCEHCYAIKMTNRLQGMPASKEKYSGSVKRTNAGNLNWTGKVTEHMSALDIPKKWLKPRRVFVGSMSDLFHDDVSFTFLEYVFDTMHQCKRHTFMVLTKRPERLAEFWEWYSNKELLSPRGIGFDHIPNVWVGTSVENQEQADNRIPHLLQVPAFVRFISCEPLLEEVNVMNYLHDSNCNEVRSEIGCICNEPREFHVDWVIAGGESGHKARPMHPDWASFLRDQCKEAGVPFFFKQWGEYLPKCQAAFDIDNSRIRHFPSPNKPDKLNDYYKVGKTISGRELYGEEHNEFPNAKSI